MAQWKQPSWKQERNAAILAAVGQGASPVAVARLYRVPLRAVLGICEGAKLRERFAQEHAQSDGPGRSRTLGPPVY
jgi:hypothetical protein